MCKFSTAKIPSSISIFDLKEQYSSECSCCGQLQTTEYNTSDNSVYSIKRKSNSIESDAKRAKQKEAAKRFRDRKALEFRELESQCRKLESERYQLEKRISDLIHEKHFWQAQEKEIQESIRELKKQLDSSALMLLVKDVE